MLSRLFMRTLRGSVTLSRNIHVSAATLGGGGSHDPVPTNIPKPGPSERNMFGEGKTSRISEDSPHVPSASDYSSYFGAAIGVLLTFLAVAYKTDVFKSSKDDHGHHSSAKKTSSAKSNVVLGPGEPPHEVSQSPLKPSPVVTSAQPEASQMESQPASERQATQQAPKEKRNEGELTKLTHTQEPPAEETPMTPNPESSDEKASKDSSANKKDGSKNAKKAANSDEIPEYIEYLLVGAGAASYYAALAIRARDADAKVLMIGDEKHLPYNRPPLSKELWWYGDETSGQTLKYKAISGKIRDIFFESQGFFVPIKELPRAKHGGVSILKEKRVVRICPSEKKAFLEDGSEIRFGKCLLATGGRPKKLQELRSPPAAIRDKIIYFHGLDDYRHLDRLCYESNSITVIGGSFVASELAYGIKRKYPKIEVNQIMKEKGNIAQVLPEHLSVKLTDSLRKFGVNVLTETNVSGVRQDEKQGLEVKLESSTARKLSTDYVVVAIGNEAETSVIDASGLEIDDKVGGVLADSELRVAPGIYCAGDVCSFFDRILGRRRVEHWEHAQITGRLAGENMTGGEKSFWFQSSFFTKFSPDYHISAVGNVDASLETISVFAKDESEDKYERGVVFYKDKKGKVVGVLMVNVFGPSLDVGRRLIEDSRPIEDFRELSKLFPLFEQPKENDGAEDVKE